MVVEPFGQHHHRPRCLVRKLQISRPRLEIFRRLRPALSVHGKRGFVCCHQLRDQYSLNRVGRLDNRHSSDLF
jgi:hypothetical protein